MKNKQIMKFWILILIFIVAIVTNVYNKNTILGETGSKSNVLETNEEETGFSFDKSEEKNTEEQENLEEDTHLDEDLLVMPTSSDSFRDLTFYEDIQTISNAESISVLVNKNFMLNSDYAPTDLVLPNVRGLNHRGNQTIYLRSEAATATEQLFSAAEGEAGLILLARSGYRSYETQEQLYQRYVEQHGQEAADKFSARAGHSEHQTGLALDVTADSVDGRLTTDFGETAEGIWLKENAHRFGFIIRYLEGRESETGYQYEPWHIRYVGVEAATIIYENGWIFEEYIN